MLDKTHKTHMLSDPRASIERQVAQLNYLAANPPEGSAVVLITPELAKKILETNNFGNRNKRTPTVHRYAKDMLGGEWALTGQPIIFGKKGELRDGQHRLFACVLSGSAFRTHAVFGVDDVFAYLDTNIVRNNSDAFQSMGIKYPNLVARTMRWITIYRRWEAGRIIDRSLTLSNHEAWEIYQKTIDHDRLAVALERTNASSSNISPANLCALFYVFEEKDPRTARRLSDDFAQGAYGASVFNKAVAEMKVQMLGRLNEVWTNAVLIKLWNMYRAGKRAKIPKSTFSWNKSEEFPAID